MTVLLVTSIIFNQRNLNQKTKFQIVKNIMYKICGNKNYARSNDYILLLCKLLFRICAVDKIKTVNCYLTNAKSLSYDKRNKTSR